MEKRIFYRIQKLVLAMMVPAIAAILVSVTGNRTQAAEYYSWPVYNPAISYDYFDEYGQISPPTQVLDDVSNDDGTPVETYVDGWWAFRLGSDKNPAVTQAAIKPMLKRFNEDFDYITNVMRWPRDKRALNGYYSTIFLYGSGLSTDDAPNTDTGGWQGATYSNGDWWPMVLASYLPVTAFDPSTFDGYQAGAMIHEGIHCILSSMPGCKNSCWFHEGGNTWLQATMESQRSGSFSGLGWLSIGAAMCPFMPIECYSGWLQDGSFGGPCAEGVNRYDGDQKLCTWRHLLGGTQYGECFPHALEVILGPKSIAWVWRNAEHSGRVLQDLAEAPGGLGEAQTRRLIQEYRARQAFCDFGPWSYAFRQLLNGQWGTVIEEEYSPYWIDVEPWTMTCYANTSRSGSVLTPDALTLPGWSGANQIPLTVDPGATVASVTFNPGGANMSCQLVYRDTSGNIRYGVPVSSGTCDIALADVMNNVVVAVICNTDYIYNGEETRTAKYNYTVTMEEGITGQADIYTKWFDHNPTGYTITASSGNGGSITPSGIVFVNAGDSQTFTFAPDSGDGGGQVSLNGLPIGTLADYTFNEVNGNHTIEVTFTKGPAPCEPTHITLYAMVNGGSLDQTNSVSATAGDDVGLSPRPATGGSWNWSGPDGYSAETREISLQDVQANDAGVYVAQHTSDCGAQSNEAFTLTVEEDGGPANIALSASVRTSYVSPWATLEAVHDGYSPSSSSDYSHGAYGNYNLWRLLRKKQINRTRNWVEYDFGATYQITSTDVYWWDNGLGIEHPTEAYIEYWDGNTWVNAGSTGVALDQWNTFAKKFSTSKIRIIMIGKTATGILEWRVWGYPSGFAQK
jgi:hypothetical protein